MYRYLSVCSCRICIKNSLNRKILPETLQMYMYIMSAVLVLTYFKHCLNVHTASVYELPAYRPMFVFTNETI